MSAPRPHRPYPLLAMLVLATAFGLVPAHGQEAELGASLESLLRHAREHNPELRALRLEAEAAHERIAPAAALPDPRFQLEMMDVTNEMSGRAATLVPGEVGETRYRVIQPLPFWGKRRLRGDVARAQAAQSVEAADTTAVALEARIKSAFVRYYEAAHQRRIVDESLSLVEALERLALTRYSVGLVPQQDVLRAQGELTALRVERVESEQRGQQAAARLNALLPRAADAALAEPAALPPARASFTLAGLLEQAGSASPELAVARLKAVAAEKSRALAYRNRYPDFALGLANNRPRSGTDTWEVMLEVQIPLQQASRRAGEREADAMLSAARAGVAAAEARLAGALGESLAGWRAYREKARLLRDTLVPQTDASLRAAQAGYEAGRVDFDTLIEAQRQRLATRLALLAADVEAALLQAELEQLVGAPL